MDHYCLIYISNDFKRLCKKIKNFKVTYANLVILSPQIAVLLYWRFIIELSFTAAG